MTCPRERNLVAVLLAAGALFLAGTRLFSHPPLPPTPLAAVLPGTSAPEVSPTDRPGSVPVAPERAALRLDPVPHAGPLPRLGDLSAARRNGLARESGPKSQDESTPRTAPRKTPRIRVGRRAPGLRKIVGRVPFAGLSRWTRPFSLSPSALEAADNARFGSGRWLRPPPRRRARTTPVLATRKRERRRTLTPLQALSRVRLSGIVRGRRLTAARINGTRIRLGRSFDLSSGRISVMADGESGTFKLARIRRNEVVIEHLPTGQSQVLKP